jgi:ABC-type Fe3+-hydroxamate transport system substrate-binding protein
VRSRSAPVVRIALLALCALVATACGATVSRIRAAHPDLVVVGPGLTADEEQRNQTFISKLAVPVYVMPGARLEDIERAAVALGVLTNHAEAGRALAISLRKQRQDVATRLEGVAPLNVYVDAGFGTSIQRTTLLARLLQLAGAHLVGPSSSVTTINAKGLHRLDPDAYIATSSSGVTLAHLRLQPRLRTLRAVAAGRFFIVDTAAARADTTAYALLHSLAHSLHPTVIKA